jgi:hypothetical protein
MTLSKNSICDFGWKARDFALKGVDGKTYTAGHLGPAKKPADRRSCENVD